MKIFLIPIIFVSVSISAQKKEKRQTLPKMDTTKIRKLDLGKIRNENQKDRQIKLYKMPNVKPKNLSMYSCLKDKRKDTVDYKILNSIIPEKHHQTTKEDLKKIGN